MLIICHGSLLIDIRYFVHDKMRWFLVIHIIEYVISTYTNILLNVCHQVKVGSHKWATTPINVFMSYGETQYTNDDKWVKSIQRLCGALIKYQYEVYNKGYLDWM